VVNLVLESPQDAPETPLMPLDDPQNSNGHVAHKKRKHSQDSDSDGNHGDGYHDVRRDGSHGNQDDSGEKPVAKERKSPKKPKGQANPPQTLKDDVITLNNLMTSSLSVGSMMMSS